MKKYLALILALVMVFALCACGGKTEAPKTDAPKTEAPKTDAPKTDAPKAEEPAATALPDQGSGEYQASDETLVVANKGNPTTLCHLTATAVSANNATLSSMYDRLVDYDYENNDVKPMLAESWERIDDTHVRFHLRKDVVSHAGDPFTASDVIFTVTNGQEGGFLSNYYGMFDLPECKAEDDYTVVLATKNPDPFFLYTLSNTPLAMIVEASTKKDGLEAQAQNPTAATGPYKFVEWNDGSYVKLERNENYWGKTPYYKNVEIRIITDASARVMNLESHDINIALDPDVNSMLALEGNPDFTIVDLPTTNITTIFMNCSKEPFNDVNLRRAIACAINYEANLKVAVGSRGKITDTNLPVNSVMYVSQPDSLYHYNVDKAKEYLAQSKYANGLEIELLYAENPIFGKYAEMVQEQLSQIGIKLNLTPIASKEFDARISAGEFQMEMINASNPDPSIQMKYYDGRIDFKANRGGCGFVDAPQELLDLIDEAKVTIDADKRLEIFNKLQAMLCDLCPAIPVYSPNKMCVMDSTIKGVTLTEFCDINWSKAYKE